MTFGKCHFGNGLSPMAFILLHDNDIPFLTSHGHRLRLTSPLRHLSPISSDSAKTVVLVVECNSKYN